VDNPRLDNQTVGFDRLYRRYYLNVREDHLSLKKQNKEECLVKSLRERKSRLVLKQAASLRGLLKEGKTVDVFDFKVFAPASGNKRESLLLKSRGAKKRGYVDAQLRKGREQQWKKSR